MRQNECILEVMQQLAIASILVGLGWALLTGCDRDSSDLSASRPAPPTAQSAKGAMLHERIKLLRERVPEMPIIVLVKQPEMSSRVLDIQNYVINGESVIPLFSTKAALNESLRGADLGRPTFVITRPLLVSMLHGSEVFLLDPQLPSQLRFTAAEFREAFPEPYVPATSQPGK